VRLMFAMVRGHWVENINWVKVASDLETKTTNAFEERLFWPGNHGKPKVS